MCKQIYPLIVWERLGSFISPIENMPSQILPFFCLGNSAEVGKISAGQLKLKQIRKKEKQSFLFNSRYKQSQLKIKVLDRASHIQP